MSDPQDLTSPLPADDQETPVTEPSDTNPELPSPSEEEAPSELDPAEVDSSVAEESETLASTQDASPLEKTSPGGRSDVAPSPDGLPRAALVAIAVLLAAGSLWIGLLWGQQKGLREAASASPSAAPTPAEATVWTCSMHPQIKLPEAGACPLCGMDLIPLEKGGGDLGPRVLELSPGAAALAGVETIPVQRRSVSREVRMVGLVDYDETRLHYITAWISGRLDRLFVDYTGTLVRKGDHLVEMYSPELLSAQEELLQAISSRTKLKESSSEFLRSTAEQTVRSAREKLRLWGLSVEQIAKIEREGKSSDHITIHATTGGVVVHKNKNRGEYVKTGERIYAIADLSKVWVKLDVYESDLSLIRYGQRVSFETEAYPGLAFEGQVVFVDPVLTGHTRTVKVRLNVDNTEGRLKPGMFVRATLKAQVESDGRSMAPAVRGKWICPMHREEIHDVAGGCSVCGMALVKAETLYPGGEAPSPAPLVVPASAVLWTGVRSLVYVQQRGTHTYEGREVVLGPRAGGFFVVREGLKEGELVVTKGSFKIDSALQIEARPSMMLPPPEGAKHERFDASAEFGSGLEPVYRAYLEVQGALAEDGEVPARAGLDRLVAGVRQVKAGSLGPDALRAWVALAKRLRDAVAKGSATASIAALRQEFAPLSEAILDLERGFGHGKGSFVEAFCPMAFDNKGAPWLQAKGAIANPYFGAAMLRCGEVRAQFEVRGQAPQAAADPHAGHSPGAPTPSPTPAPAGSPASHPATQPSTRPAVKSGALREQLRPLVEAYLALQHDLSKDRALGGAHSQKILAALGAVKLSGLSTSARGGWERDAPALRALGSRLAGAEGIAAERVVFHDLSRRLEGVLVSSGPPAGVTLRRFHCPMAFGNTGADWLQTADRTENPYFGAQMYRCGGQVKVLETKPAPAGDGK